MGKPDLTLRRRGHRKAAQTFCSDLVHTLPQSTHVQRQQFDRLYQFASKCFPVSGNFTPRWVREVLLQIDVLWFENTLFSMATHLYGGVDIYISIQDPQFSGYIEESRDSLSLHLNRRLVMDLFTTGDTGYHSGGLLCRDRLTCLLHVMVHETVHIGLTICDRLQHHDDTQHHGKVFQQITHRLFGHTDTKHGLIMGLNHAHDLTTLRKVVTKGRRVKIYLNDAWTPGTVVRANRINVDVQTDANAPNLYSVHMGLIELL